MGKIQRIRMGSDDYSGLSRREQKTLSGLIELKPKDVSDIISSIRKRKSGGLL